MIEIRYNKEVKAQFHTGNESNDLVSAVLYVERKSGMNVTEASDNGWQIVGVDRVGNETCAMCGNPLPIP